MRCRAVTLGGAGASGTALRCSFTSASIERASLGHALDRYDGNGLCSMRLGTP